ncbi:hypothetical protein CBL_11545 [Carabus blaptoides fortunei]
MQHITLEYTNLHPPPLSAKYLGITFNYKLNWTPDIRACRTKMFQRASLIANLRSKIHGCSEQVLKTTYKTFVRAFVDFHAVVYAATSYVVLPPDIGEAILRRTMNLNHHLPLQ